MSAYETHNRLAQEFATMAATNTASAEELMVIVESCLLASMTLLVRQHRVKPQHASIYMEAALQVATERYAEIKHG